MNASRVIDKQIADLGDWRGEIYAQLRKVVSAVNVDLKEEVKWGASVWTKGSNVCAICAMKDHVKINFFQGAALADPKKLFNAGLDAKKTRAIDFFEGDKIDEAGLKDIIQSAVAINQK